MEKMEDNSLSLIDVDKMLGQKLGAKATYVPGFVRNYLKKLIHQDELNQFLVESKDKTGVPFLKACVEFLDDKVTVKGMEKLPEGGPFTFVSNHPLGALDGVAIGSIIGEHYNGKIKYLVNDLLMTLRGMAPLCIPINKTGSQSRDFPKMVEGAFASDDNVIMFPAGVCSRWNDKKEIIDIKWKKTFVNESYKNHRDVVPMHFSGKNSDKFYRLARRLNFKRLKFNPAMILLPDEMMKNRHKEFVLTIGDPIPWETFDGSKSPSEWAQYVKDIVYSLQ